MNNTIMQFTIEVNNRQITARKGETILSALQRAGIRVPTICSMKDFSPTGACRMCVVEVEGKANLVPSCSYPVEEWMKIYTHSPRVIKARKTIVELLLSNHPDDCLYCERNGNCELQKLAEELFVRERRIPGSKTRYKLDKSSPSIVREPSKCILCGRCVRVCEEVQGVSTFDFAFRGSNTQIAAAFSKDLNFSNCIHCGQCVVICPTGALVERVQFPELEQHLHDPKKTVVVQYSPSVTATLSEEFELKTGKDWTGILNALLRKIGFDLILETSFASDLYVMETTSELVSRIRNKESIPLFSSCCPGWVKYLEQSRPDLLKHLATTKSPQQLMGSLIKTRLCEQHRWKSEQVFSVAIMPCTAKKFESQRVEMTRKGVSDIDLVITTRELARLIRLYGIDLNTLDPEYPETSLRAMTSAGKLAGVTGGTMESFIRTFHFRMTGKDLKDFRLLKIRGMKERRELKLQIGNQQYGFAVINGMTALNQFLNEVEEGRDDIHFAEVMACQGGCINGGGQPIRSGESILRNRIKLVYEQDEKEMIKFAHRNPNITELYRDFLGDADSEKIKTLLHTRYTKRDVLL
ncbi:MAG: [FeFe] hydrogenase, group A [Bacteroidales bacterium]